MQFAHDVFSLIAMLKTLKLSNIALDSHYQALLNSSNSLEVIHSELLKIDQSSTVTVTHKDEIGPVVRRRGTGSPAIVNA